MSVFDPGARVHVVGVGGAGMSALAILLAEGGAVVSGSDAHDSLVLEELRTRGVDAHAGHDVAHARGARYVLWSPAVDDGHPELRAARDGGAEALTRARVLGELATRTRVLGIAGTHGKTTTTSMLVQISLAAGRDDAWLVGAPVLGVGANGHWGRGDTILEVDESYGTFAELAPFALGLLNVEADHLDYYGSLGGLEAAFVALVERTSGPVVAWVGDPGASRCAQTARREVTTVGLEEGQWRVTDVHLERRRSNFVLEGSGERLAVTLRITGAHNVANAAVAAALAISIGVDGGSVVEGLSNFVGAPRRDQFRGTWRDVDVYETYAHLPGELTASVAALRSAGYERVTIVFQPHRVTRTITLLDQFAPAFDEVAHVVVTDLYAAGEPNPEGVTGNVVAQAIRARDAVRDVEYVADLGDVARALASLVETSDVILVAGAGDVAAVIEQLSGGLS